MQPDARPTEATVTASTILARRWPVALGSLICLTCVTWASLALVRQRHEAGAAIVFSVAVMWEALLYGSWIPFAWLIDRLIRRVGMTGHLLASLYGVTALGGLVHACVALGLDRAFAGWPITASGLIDRLPIDLLMAVATTAFVAAVYGLRAAAAERCRAASLEMALAEAREAARLAPAEAPGIEPESLLVSTGSSLTPVPLAVVECFAAAGNYVVVNWAGREGLVRDTLGGLAERLDPAVFVRAHRSTIVNLAMVRDAITLSDGGWMLRTISGCEIVVSRTYRDPVLKRLGRR